MNSSAPVSLSPSRRAWLRFKRNRLGYWSLIAFCALVLLSLMAAALGMGTLRRKAVVHS